MANYNCIIIDDDEVARLKVVSVARSFPILNIVGVYSSADAAFSIIEKEKMDVLFLDIDMPSMNGLDFRKKLMNIPVCVYITAHPEFAVESFELETLDFIVKPLRLERFAQTVNRIDEFMQIKHKATLYEMSFGDDIIYIKQGYEQTKIHLHEILYLEALKDYTLLITAQKRHCVFVGIGNLLKEPNFQSFIRVHRSFAVAKQYVEKAGSNSITLQNNVSIPVGYSYKENLNLIL